jgi:hypothetical protein
MEKLYWMETFSPHIPLCLPLFMSTMDQWPHFWVDDATKSKNVSLFDYLKWDAGSLVSDDNLETSTETTSVRTICSNLVGFLLPQISQFTFLWRMCLIKVCLWKRNFRLIFYIFDKCSAHELLHNNMTRMKLCENLGADSYEDNDAEWSSSE